MNKPAPSSDEYASALAASLPRLRRLARRFTRDDDDAADLVQDTLLNALRFRDHFAPGTRLEAFLATVMRNRAASLGRRRGLERRIREQQHGTLVAGGFAEAPCTHPTLEPAPTTGLTPSLRRALDDLPPAFRGAVELCDLDDCTYAEAAIRLGCPVGTVMSRLHRARRLLRERLDEGERWTRAA